MKQIASFLKNSIANLKRGVENYFLGPKPIYFEDGSCSLWQYFEHDDVDENILKSLACLKFNDSTMLIMLLHNHNIRAFEKISKFGNEPIIFLFPHYLEMAYVMLQEMVKNVAGQKVVILINISGIPCFEEFKLSNLSHHLNDSHSRAFFEFFKKVKRLHQEESLLVIVFDHEDILGQKNSAFLKRLFSN